MNTNLSDEQAKQIGTALEAGNKIEAIKLYREFTGSDLRTAKESVETLIGGLVEREPQKYAKLTQASKGCAVRIGVLAVFAIAVLYIVAGR